MVKPGKRGIRKSWFTRRRIIVVGIIVVLALAFFYWEEKGKVIAKPTVVVTKVIREKVPVYIDFVANTVSKKVVDIRARVEGFLEQRLFVEGDDVPKGKLLYVIDQRPFEAALMQARGQLAKDEAALAFAKEQVDRYKPLVEKDFVSKENYDNYVTQANELKGVVKSDRAAVTQAELNLSWCTMNAPFPGRIGRTLVNTGNLVGAGGQDTKLTTLVMLDPIYVYFSPSDEELQRIMKYANQGELKADLTGTDGTRYGYQGTLDFVDNKVNKKTSTIAMRVIVPNPDGELMPGVYMNLKLLLDDEEALLVPQKALSEDQGGQFVMIVPSNEVVKKSYVTVGASYGENVAVKKGVKEGESVIVEGLQLARPGTPVKTEDVAKQDTMQDVVNSAVMGKK